MLYGYKILVYCTSKLYEEKFYNFISSLNDELVAHNWRVMIFSTETDLYNDNPNNRGDAKFFDLINYDIADAFLLDEEKFYNEEAKSKIIEEAAKRKIPVFSLQGHRENTYNLDFDLHKGFYKVVNHIINQHGIRDVHFFAGTKGSWQSQDREDVFKQVLKENDIPFDESMISYGDWWYEPSEKITQQLIDQGRIPRAIICANDAMAIAVTTVLQKNGIRCPEDVIVSGFDGIETIFFTTPKITSAVCNFQYLGIETANFITEVDSIHSKPCTKHVETSLIISESCGCQPVKPANTTGYINALYNHLDIYRNNNRDLNNLAVSIALCTSIEEVMKVLKSPWLYNVNFLVKTECLDKKLNPDISLTESTYGKTMFLLLDSDADQEPDNRYIQTEDLIPRMETYLKDYKKPLIFAPVNHKETPIGYLMYCFPTYNIRNYTTIHQTATWLAIGIAGFRSRQYIKNLNAEITELKSYDSLTGLCTRHEFLKIYADMKHDSKIKTISMVVCEMDDLKYINETYSFNDGDYVLRTAARVLSTTFENGYYCRYNGDELVALYPYIANRDYFQKKVDQNLEPINDLSKNPYRISVSCGVSTSKGLDFQEQFIAAEKDMEAAKLERKNKTK